MLTPGRVVVGPFAEAKTPHLWMIQIKEGDTVVEAYSFSALEPELARRRAVDYLAVLERQQWRLIPGARLEQPVQIVSPFSPTVTKAVEQLTLALQAGAPAAEAPEGTPA